VGGVVHGGLTKRGGKAARPCNEAMPNNKFSLSGT